MAIADAFTTADSNSTALHAQQYNMTVYRVKDILSALCDCIWRTLLCVCVKGLYRVGAAETYSWVRINVKQTHRPVVNSVSVPTLFCTERVFG